MSRPLRLACLAGLVALAGCSSAANIGLPTVEPVAVTTNQSERATEAAEIESAAGNPMALASDGAVPAGPNAPAVVASPQPAVAQGDADPDAVVPPAATASNDILPWPSINRWPADQDGDQLLTAEEAEATRQSLTERAAQQVRQAFELLTLKRQREAAQEALADAAERTRNVLAGIASKCRTGQPDEACPDESAEAGTTAAPQ